jgi:phage-related minor tail protein
MLFPLPNGIGLAGEAGAEAVMPLTRDGRGRLAVHAPGAAQGPAPTINVNVDARGSSDPAATEQAVRRAVAASVPAMVDAFRRGGPVRAALKR